MNHVKSCGAVIFRREKQKLFFLTVKYVIEPDYWGLVKGHVEPGESEEQTARREIAEEAGIKRLQFIAGFRTTTSYVAYSSPGNGVNKTVVFFLAEARSKKLTFDAPEQSSGEWLEFNEIMQRLKYNNDKQIVRKANAYLKKKAKAG